MPTCLVHNCETSWGLLYFHLLSLLSRDQIPFDPHQQYVKVDTLGRLCDNDLERSYDPFTTTNLYFIGAAYNSYFLIIYKPSSLIISPWTFSMQLGAGTAWFCLSQCAIPFCTLSTESIVHFFLSLPFLLYLYLSLRFLFLLFLFLCLPPQFLLLSPFLCHPHFFFCSPLHL